MLTDDYTRDDWQELPRLWGSDRHKTLIENIQPGQQIIKIVSDELTEILGVQSSELNFKNKPSTFLMCGLQGAGKTTSIAKLAHYCQNSLNKSVALVSTDLRRPAAIDQLRILSQKNNIQFIEPINENIKETNDACNDFLDTISKYKKANIVCVHPLNFLVSRAIL